MMNERTAVVVEDDHDVGDAISALLDQAGFNVFIARTGADAFDRDHRAEAGPGHARPVAS